MSKVYSTFGPRGFTLLEVLVVISVILLLSAIILPSLYSTRQGAKGITCRSNLRQLSLLFSAYAHDSDGHIYDPAHTYPMRWYELLKSDSSDEIPNILFCPVATKKVSAGGQHPFAAWEDSNYSGSYGMNCWLYDSQGTIGRPTEYYWESVYVPCAAQVPLFIGCSFMETGPLDEDVPPAYDGDVVAIPWDSNSMKRVCLNRHRGMTNAAFLDSSVRRVGLKELWTFKWHPKFNTCGIWTRAGGVRVEEWPEWMRNFRDY